MLQNILVEICTSLTQCAAGVQKTIEVLSSFTWGFLSGRVKLADVSKMLAARNAKQYVCASLLMHIQDLEFLLRCRRQANSTTREPRDEPSPA